MGLWRGGATNNGHSGTVTIHATPTRVINGVRVNATHCEPCEAGTFNARSDEMCDNCAAGRYAGVTAATACIACSAGRYAEIAARECDSCPAGTYNPDSGSISYSACIDCVEGKYNPSARSTNVGDCIDCPAGKYSSEPLHDCDISRPTAASTAWNRGSGLLGTCAGDPATRCDSSHIEPQTAAECEAAAVAMGLSFVNCGSSGCSADPPGCWTCCGGSTPSRAYWNPLYRGRELGSGNSNRFRICYAADSVSLRHLGSSSCDNCVAGKYSPDAGSAGLSSCIDCAAGRYSSIDAAASCSDCTPGHETTDGYTTMQQDALSDDCPGLDLAKVRSPYAGSTSGASDDLSSCAEGSDRVFFIDLDPGQTLDIGQTTNNYNRHSR